MFRLKTQIPLLAAAVLLVVPAEASTTYFSGNAAQKTAFTSAAGTLSLLNPAMTFSGDLEPNGLLNAAGININFLGNDDSNNPLSFTLSAGQLTAAQNAEQVTISLPAGIFALGLDMTTVAGTGFWCVELAHGTCDVNIFNSAPSSPQFFGVLSTTAISTLYIRSTLGSPKLVLQDFAAYGASSSSAVPEPRTMLLAGLGLAILGLVRQKSRREIQQVL